MLKGKKKIFFLNQCTRLLLLLFFFVVEVWLITVSREFFKKNYDVSLSSKTIQIPLELEYIILNNFLARVTCLFLTKFSHEDSLFFGLGSRRGDDGMLTNYISFAL